MVRNPLSVRSQVEGGGGEAEMLTELELCACGRPLCRRVTHTTSSRRAGAAGSTSTSTSTSTSAAAARASRRARSRRL